MKRYRTLSQQLANPAAGAGLVFTPSPVQRFRLLSMVLGFSTDATVASRLVFATVNDPSGAVVFETGDPTTQPASTSIDRVIAAGFATTLTLAGPVNGARSIPWNDIWLPPGWSIRVNFRSGGPADQFSGISYAGDFAEDIWDQEQDEAVRMAFLSSLMA